MQLPRYPRYESYKDSGVEWLGKVPQEWSTIRLKYISREQNQKITASSVQDRYIGMENVESWSGKLVDTDSDAEGLANIFVSQDILFGKLRPYLAKVHLAEGNGICSSEFMVLRFGKDFSKRFYYYTLISNTFIGIVNGSTYGSKMPRANPSFVSNCEIPVPPVEEQHAIARFLDDKTDKIDRAVKIKEEQIALLRERKQIIIQEAVTKGLNPDAPMKDSGIDWIGQIPVSWDIQPLRAIFGFRNEKNDPVRTENILSLSIAHGVTEYTEEGRGGNKRKDDLTAYKLAYEGDIVLNSMNVIVGAVGRSKFFGAISPVYYALFPLHETTYVPFFENIFLNSSFQRGLLRYGKGILIKLSDTGKLNTIRMKISTNDLKVLTLPVPSDREQKAIVEFIDREASKINDAIQLKERQIEAIKEYKATMISAAVTGKIKVI